MTNYEKGYKKALTILAKNLKKEDVNVNSIELAEHLEKAIKEEIWKKHPLVKKVTQNKTKETT